VFQKIFSELKKNDISFYCLLFILTVAVGGGFIFSVPLQILCLFALLACFSFLFINKSFENNGIFVVLLPLIAIAVSYLGADFQTNVRTASLGLLNAILAFFIVSYSDARNKENILITLIIFAVWISFLLFVQALSSNSDSQNAMLLNVNIAAGFLLLVYPLCFSFVENNKRPLLFLSIAFFIFAAVIITKSRSAIIIAYLVSIFYFIRLRKNAAFKMFFAAISFFVLAGIIYAFKAKAGWQSFEDRLIWQKTAVLMLKENPIFGVGFGNFSAMFVYYRTEFVVNTLFAHNIIAQLLAEVGIFGFVCFFAAAFVFVKNAVVFLRENVNLACSVCAASFIVLNLSDYSFFIPANTIAFFIICGIAFNAQTRLRDKKFTAASIIIAAAVLIYVFLNVLTAHNHFVKGDALHGEGKFKQAAKEYLQALKYDGKNADYWYRLYENGNAEKNYNGAINYLLNAEKYYRRSSQIKAEAAYLYKILGDEKNAAKYAKLAKEYDKFNPFYK
jgi:O-antigen ligase